MSPTAAAQLAHWARVQKPASGFWVATRVSPNVAYVILDRGGRDATAGLPLLPVGDAPIQR